MVIDGYRMYMVMYVNVCMYVDYCTYRVFGFKVHRDAYKISLDYRKRSLQQQKNERELHRRQQQEKAAAAAAAAATGDTPMSGMKRSK